MALTAFFLLLFGAGDTTHAQEIAPEPPATATSTATTVQPDEPTPRNVDEVIDAAEGEARTAAARLREDFFAILPKLLVALLVLVAAWVLVRILRLVLKNVAGSWERGAAVRAIVAIVIWVLAAAVAVSIVAGDVRAVVGSLGLFGLALSWALQTPIESFTGWLLNSFRGYYRVGDRIAVGDLQGEVYRVDFLNTTLWEIGNPSREGTYVKSEQATGRLITFPNSEVLAGSIINFTRDFPWVWDEYELAIANESDLRYSVDVVHRIADEVLGAVMHDPAKTYERILAEAGLERVVTPHPEVFISTSDWATLLVIRYLVNARERRRWKSELIAALQVEITKPEHRNRIRPVYPRRQIEVASYASRETWDAP